jgi:hypothetical protein
MCKIVNLMWIVHDIASLNFENSWNLLLISMEFVVTNLKVDDWLLQGSQWSLRLANMHHHCKLIGNLLDFNAI